MTVAEAATYLKQVYGALCREADFSPENPRVNHCLGGLVSSVSVWHARGQGAPLLTDSGLADVRDQLPDLCGCAECHMEKWWARRIVAARHAADELRAFWYLDNYRTLCHAEAQLLGPDGTRRLAFLGGGALPLTGILLAQAQPDTRIRCIDTDAEACDLAQSLVGALGLKTRVEIVEQRAEDFTPFTHETVVCASLLRADGLYDRLHAAGVQRLLVRDAEDVFQFLYKPAQLPGAGYRQTAKTVPTPGRINTSRLFERVAA
jgi:hypothetical protein